MFSRAKKSLGQNFLHSEGALRSMIKAAEVSSGDTIIEIGPGRGALTRALLATGATVIAIEKDDALITPLTELFSDAINTKQLTLVHDDALTVNLYTLTTKPFKLIANIPYYITGALIERFLSNEPQPTSATVIVQKEVAERIVARNGKGSILSIAVQAYGEPHYIETVKRGSFFPVPNVDSAILHIANISKQRFMQTHVTEERFFSVLKGGFAHKRKQLGNNLETLVSESVWGRCGFTKQTRAETLSVDDWFCLATEQ